MNFLSDELLEYAAQHSSRESALLKQIDRDTHLHVLKPRMLSGHHQGRLLSFISKMVRPRNILEVGTYTGYSAICLAEGLEPEGKLVTIDMNEELYDRVSGYFQEAHLTSKIEYVIGNALDIIPTLNESWDLVFIDADKVNYPQYYELALQQASSGGVIILDNVLWSGKVLDDTKVDEDTKALRELNSFIQQDNRVENVLLPVRDGLMIVRKC